MKIVSRTRIIISPEICFKLLMVLVWIQHTIFPYILQIYRRLPVIGQLYESVYPMLVIVLLLLSMPYYKHKIKIWDILLYICCISVVILTLAFMPENAMYVEAAIVEILVTGIPMYFIGISYDHKNMKELLYYASALGVLITLGYQLYRVSTGVILVADNMDTAYKVLPSTMFLLYMMFESTNIVSCLLAVMGIWLAFILGTRGPILAIGVFIALGLSFKIINMKSPWIKILSTICAGWGISIFFVEKNFVKMISLLAAIFEKIGISSRIFKMSLDGTIASSTGREQIYSTVIQAIKERPVIGYGLMGDRVLMGRYAHNIFLEIWCDYGVILGTGLIILVFYIFIRAVYRQRRSNMFYFLLAMVCMIIIKLSFSGSYIYEQYFYLIVGICAAAGRKKRIDSQNW